MTHYLYIKTHRKTGLKYLGKTTQDPYKYNGSGKYWKLHMSVHGAEHDTEILCECSSAEELRKEGIYYSMLWNVVESHEWANLKPENGDGGSIKGHKKSKESVEKRSGDKHPRKTNPEKWKDAEEMLKNRDMPWIHGNNHPMKDSEIIDKISGDNHYMRQDDYDNSLHPSKNPTVLEKWRVNRKGSNHNQYDKTNYQLYNKKTQETFIGKRYDFIQTYNLQNHAGNISMMIDKRRKSVKGWVVL